jgi:hypothetical protein
VVRQDVGSMIFVGVNVMSMHAGEAISDARRGIGVVDSASLCARVVSVLVGELF